MKKIFTLVLLSSLFLQGYCGILAFPGAEGFGKNATGGRGGKVIYVTSLEDNISTPGTFRWALNQTSPKIILFKVSGTIMLKSNLDISKGNTTIAGQSAPGDGICVGGFPVFIKADNVIIRFMRFRMGDNLDSNADGADALGARYYKNFIVDHCSMSWSTDECVSIYGNTNTTVQWCLISESLRLSGHTKGAHGYGGIWGGSNATFHHNLMAHHDSRVPRLGPSVKTQKNELTDIRNNVYYNYSGEGCYGGEAMKANLVNNFYRPGPASNTGTKRGRIMAIDKKINLATGEDFYPINNVWGQFFIDGNVIDASTSTGSDATVCQNATANNWTYGVYNQIHSKYGTLTNDEKAGMKTDTPFECGGVTTHTAQKAYEKVLAYAGASLARDSHDRRVIEETTNGTATYKGLSALNTGAYPKMGIIDSQNDLKPADAPADWSPWPTLLAGETPADSDEDGIPDAWETAHNLNPNDAADAKTTTLDGLYPNIEVYLYSLVDHIISKQVEEGVMTEKTSIGLVQPAELELYPNPASTQLNLRCSQSIETFSVFNIGGSLMATGTPKSVQTRLPVTDLNSGVYFVKIETAERQKMIRMFIKR